MKKEKNDIAFLISISPIYLILFYFLFSSLTGNIILYMLLGFVVAPLILVAILKEII